MCRCSCGTARFAPVRHRSCKTNTRRHGTYTTHPSTEPANCQANQAPRAQPRFQSRGISDIPDPRTPAWALRNRPNRRPKRRHARRASSFCAAAAAAPIHDQANGTAADHYDEMNTTTPATDPSRPTARQTARRALRHGWRRAQSRRFPIPANPHGCWGIAQTEPLRTGVAMPGAARPLCRRSSRGTDPRPSERHRG